MVVDTWKSCNFIGIKAVFELISRGIAYFFFIWAAFVTLGAIYYGISYIISRDGTDCLGSESKCSYLLQILRTRMCKLKFAFLW